MSDIKQEVRAVNVAAATKIRSVAKLFAWRQVVSGAGANHRRSRT
jgi:hypothetical protein